MRTINVDVSDTKSVKEASDYVRKYSNMVSKKLKSALEKICKEGAIIAAQEFGASVEVSYTFPEDNLCVVSADSNVVCFLEFGTGFDTDSAYPYTDQLPFEVKPGSWSMTEGAGTYDDYLRSGGDPALYPYNHMPRHAMLHAYEKMYEIAEKTIKEVFDK